MNDILEDDDETVVSDGVSRGKMIALICVGVVVLLLVLLTLRGMSVEKKGEGEVVLPEPVSSEVSPSAVESAKASPSAVEPSETVVEEPVSLPVEPSAVPHPMVLSENLEVLTSLPSLSSTNDSIGMVSKLDAVQGSGQTFYRAHLIMSDSSLGEIVHFVSQGVFADLRVGDVLRVSYSLDDLGNVNIVNVSKV